MPAVVQSYVHWGEVLSPVYFPSPVVAGNLLVVVVGHAVVNATFITDSLGSTWFRAYYDATAESIGVYYALAANSGVCGVTVNNATTLWTHAMLEVSGAQAVVDGVPTSANGGATSPGSITTTAVNSFVVVGLTTDIGTTFSPASWTAPGGWGLVQDAGGVGVSNFASGISWMVQGSPGAVSPTFSGTNISTDAQVIVAFLEVVPYSILTSKELVNPGRPLYLVDIVTLYPAPSGHAVFLATAPAFWMGNLYRACIQSQDIEAISSVSVQGYDSPGSFTLTIGDGDFELWTNDVIPYGWKGAAATIRMITWDIPTNKYSTDAIVWTFILDNPSITSQGVITVSAVNRAGMTRLKLPSIPRSRLCPWLFPPDLASRTDGLINLLSPFAQCGYSPDLMGGVGNYQTGTTPFIDCDFTKANCVARGMFDLDSNNNPTFRNGGDTWIANPTYLGTTYTSGEKTFGYNTPNPPGNTFYNLLYGDQWVPATVLEIVGEPNSTRFEAVVVVALYGKVESISKVVVNGHEVPYLGSNVAGIPADTTFRWNYTGGAGGTYHGVGFSASDGSGGRSGMLLGDIPYNFSGDPHGSLCVIECVVPSTLAASDTVPTVLVEFDVLFGGGPPTLITYPVWQVSGNVVFFKDSSVPGGPNKWFTANNGVFSKGVPGLTDGPQPITTWDNSSITLVNAPSGPGGFLYRFGSNTNPVWHLLDLLALGPYTDLAQLDIQSFYDAAQVCDEQINYTAADTSIGVHSRFESSFVLDGNNRQPLSAIVRSLRNNAGLLLGYNSNTGLLQCNIEQSLADQQPLPVPGSNYNVPIPSTSANGIATLASGIGTGVGLFTINLNTPVGPDITALNPMKLVAGQMILIAAEFMQVVSGGWSNTVVVLRQWDPTYAYSTGQFASYGGVGYFALANNTNVEPDLFPFTWQATMSLAAGTHPGFTPVFPCGYLAYLFDGAGSIEAGSFSFTTRSMNDTPNQVSFQFQDIDNDLQVDSLTQIDPQAYALSGNQQIVDQFDQLGIRSFDQGTRRSNVELAKAFRGNFRDFTDHSTSDAGGTMYPQFVASLKALHLNRSGLICGINYEQLGI